MHESACGVGGPARKDIGRPFLKRRRNAWRPRHSALKLLLKEVAEAAGLLLDEVRARRRLRARRHRHGPELEHDVRHVEERVGRGAHSAVSAATSAADGAASCGSVVYGASVPER